MIYTILNYSNFKNELQVSMRLHQLSQSKSIILMITLLGHMESIILLIDLDWRLRPHLQAMSIITELEYCLDNLLLS